jgi:hypothetical protein
LVQIWIGLVGVTIFMSMDVMILMMNLFDRYVSDYLDKIIDKLDDNSLYHDIHEYSELYKRLSSKYNLDGRYFTKNKRDFFYRGIDPETNRILIQVFKKEGGLEDRSYTEEEFNNFLVSPELFEGFIRIN